MWRRQKARGTKLHRQVGLGLLQDAMGRVEEEHSPCEAGYSLRMPPDVAYLVVVGVPGGPEAVEYVDTEHKFPFGSHYPAGGG
jgi:hypothetical protein